jgi:hypothetical protein
MKLGFKVMPFQHFRGVSDNPEGFGECLACANRGQARMCNFCLAKCFAILDFFSNFHERKK